MMSIMIDAHENCDVAGAYLKAYMDDFVVRKFAGQPADILCKMNSEHMRFVVVERG